MTLKSLGILKPAEMPALDVILVESPQPKAPYGIKGVGEIGLVPTAGAVAAALHDLDGVWRNELPMRAQAAKKRVRSLSERSEPGREEAARRRREPRESGRPPRARSEGSEPSEERGEQ
jgi:hypothetical protein